MNPKLLRTVLTWLAPVIIGYIVKKIENKQNKKRELTQKNS